MIIKKLLISTVLGASVLTTPLVIADQTGANANSSTQIKKIHGHHGFNKLLTAQENSELRAIMKNFHEQMAPLVKEKVALKLQLRGKIATPQTQWADISKLIEQINENNAKITTLIARTQLSTFQKLGVLMPLPHHHFKGRFKDKA